MSMYRDANIQLKNAWLKQKRRVCSFDVGVETFVAYIFVLSTLYTVVEVSKRRCM